ncbi:hypothetical protein CsatA_019408 [Cannabis sativa]
MEKLGYDNMLEILRRLIEDKNKKELIRYKCVSTLWHNVISDIHIRIIWSQTPIGRIYFRIMRAPPFVNYIVSLLSHTTCTVSERQFLKTHMLSNCNEYNKTIFIPMTWDHGDNRFDSNNSVFIDCCNDLLLLFHFKYDTYYVSNPYTRQRAHIPKPPHHHYAKDNILCAALAFDPIESSLGGFAVVTKCNNNLDKAPYTIKKVSILEGVEDFDFKYCIREDKFLASLDHPNIIRYYSVHN